MDERLTEAVKYKNALNAFIKSEGWKVFVDIARENIHNRTQVILLEPSTSMDDVLPKEFMKGEVAGITAMLLYPEIKIEECEALIDALKEKPNAEEKSSNSDN